MQIDDRCNEGSSTSRPQRGRDAFVAETFCITESSPKSKILFLFSQIYHIIKKKRNPEGDYGTAEDML